MNWNDTPPNWNTPIGKKIDRFFQAVAERFPGYRETIVVFGSATIHLRLDPDFNSADADLRVNADDILAFKAQGPDGRDWAGQERQGERDLLPRYHAAQRLPMPLNPKTSALFSGCRSFPGATPPRANRSRTSCFVHTPGIYR